MNALLTEMKRSLAELDLGLKGDLTISEPMEKLMNSLANDAVPGTAEVGNKSCLLTDNFLRELEEPGVSISKTTGFLAEQSAPESESTL